MFQNWTPDPFDVAQGRGEQSRTTIKTSFVGDALKTSLISWFPIPLSLLRGCSTRASNVIDDSPGIIGYGVSTPRHVTVGAH
jgi:hypothetical protein